MSKEKSLLLVFVFAISLLLSSHQVYADGEVAGSSENAIIIGDAEVEKIIEEVCRQRQVPSEIVKAIAYKESKMQQWYADGSPVVSYNGRYLGIMQVSSAAGYDNSKLKNDIYYNLNAGIDVLLLKWDMSINNYSVPKFENMDKAIIENWYFAIWAYNGWLSRNNPNYNPDAYQEKIFDLARERYGAEISSVDTSLLPASGLPAKRLVLANGENEHRSISFEVLNPFLDLEENWAKDIIFEMYKKGYIKGITETTFEPDNNIRIDEFITILSRYLNLGQTEDYNHRFTEKISDWAIEHIDSLDSKLLLYMYGEDTDFSRFITRGEVANIIAQYIINYDTQGKYTDVDDVVITFEDLPVDMGIEEINKIKILYKNNIIVGRDYKTYAYEENITRAEVAAIIWKMMSSISF